jgi:ABC-type phosphate transport system substrate-binding protein
MHAIALRIARMAALAVLPLAGMTTGATAQTASGEGVAIVVHPNAPVDALSLDQLRRIFMADQQFWPDGSRITLLVRAPAAYEREVVLNVIYRMSEDEFRKYWVGKMFRAEVPAGPKIVYSSEMAGELVTAVPGAIAFVPAGDVSPNARVLRIDGRRPGEPGYPLQ